MEGGEASTDTVLSAMLAEGEITLQRMARVARRDRRVRSEEERAKATDLV